MLHPIASAVLATLFLGTSYSQSNATVRLAGSLVPHAGRVEVYTLGQWGTVCNDFFDLTDASVVCRELGYPGALAVSYFGEGNGTILLDDVACMGEETSILECQHGGLFGSDCTHTEDVGVICDAAELNLTSHEIRLVGGDSGMEGRVEIRYDGEWGTICDQGWGIREAEVVCRQLGYPFATDALREAYFGEGSGPVLIGLVHCHGNESELAFCSSAAPGNFSDCFHSNNSGVRCSASPPPADSGNLRLTGGDREREGTLEVYYNETWGTVCASSFGLTEANVACRQLGYFEALRLGETDQSGGRVWLSDVDCYGDESRLVDCDYWGWSVPCDTVITLECEEDPFGCDIRLVEGRYEWEGALEVFSDDQWGRVCAEDWGLNDADVVCRQLGYLGALDAPSLIRFPPSELVLLTGVQCNGTEDSLCGCASNGIGPTDCPSSCFLGCEAGVVCQEVEAAPLGVRLVGGSVEWEGRVEVRVNRVWGTICSLTVDLTIASVICRELGYTGALEVSYYSRYGQGSGPQWLDQLSCTGEEDSIFHCNHGGLGVLGCGHLFDLGVVCEGMVSNTTAPIRLVSGATLYEGRVEILYNGLWGTICNNGWTLEDAHVACRQLGFGPALAALTFSLFGFGEGTVWLDELACGGSEGALSECSHNGWGAPDCTHVEDAGVRCSALTNHPFDIRLANGSYQGVGRVEIFYGGVWGTVCNSTWNITAANVVCRQLGYSGAVAAVVSLDAGYGEGGGVVWIERVECGGSETRLVDCSFQGWGSTSCSHDQDAGVICETSVRSGSVRLVGGASHDEGRVEVFYSGVWGTVCDFLWDHRDGDIVCRQLGYLRALRVTGKAAFGEGAGPIWLGGLSCTGEEEEIADCSHLGWGMSSCLHDDDAGVACTYDPELSVRLVGGANGAEGRVEILYNSTWGTICDNTWDIRDASVVCHHLGFPGATSAPRGAEFGPASDLIPIWLEEVHCTGSEENLDQCNHDDYGLHSCFGGHSEDAGVVCEVDTEVPLVRLVGGDFPSEGRVEVFINGQWGSVCDDFFSWYEGSVVCRQLNYTGIIRVGDKGEFGAGSGPIWLDDVFCYGDETSITQCSNNGYGMHNCDHAEDVGVVCDVHHPGEEGAIRLVGGDGISNGRVEVFHDGEWGTVCDYNWGLEDASVVCRQLNLTGVISAPHSAAFGEGIGRMWLEGVACTGSEERLEECAHSGWGNIDLMLCGHEYDAAVVCEKPESDSGSGMEPDNYDVRLVGGADQYSGLLEVFFNGVWGTICQTSFNDSAALVVCKQLGYPGGVAVTLTPYGRGEGVVWLENVQCNGIEENLNECFHSLWGEHSCFPVPHMWDVSIQCQAPLPSHTITSSPHPPPTSFLLHITTVSTGITPPVIITEAPPTDSSTNRIPVSTGTTPPVIITETPPTDSSTNRIPVSTGITPPVIISEAPPTDSSTNRIPVSSKAMPTVLSTSQSSSPPVVVIIFAVVPLLLFALVLVIAGFLGIFFYIAKLKLKRIRVVDLPRVVYDHPDGSIHGLDPMGSRDSFVSTTTNDTISTTVFEGSSNRVYPVTIQELDTDDSESQLSQPEMEGVFFFPPPSPHTPLDVFYGSSQLSQKALLQSDEV